MAVCVCACVADSFMQTVMAFSSFVFLFVISSGLIRHRNKLEIGSLFNNNSRKNGQHPRSFLLHNCTPYDCNTRKKSVCVCACNGGDSESKSGIIIFIASRTQVFPISCTKISITCARCVCTSM